MVWLALDGFFCELAFSSRFHSFLGETDWTVACCWLLSVYTPVRGTIHLIWNIKKKREHQPILLPSNFSKSSLKKCESSNHTLETTWIIDISNLTHVNTWLVSCLKVIFVFLIPDTWNYSTDYIFFSHALLLYFIFLQNHIDKCVDK